MKNIKHYIAWALNLPVIRSIAPDKWYLSIRYFEHFGKNPDFKNPATFNEKLQWLKINYRKNEFTKMVDKYAVREYIAEKIGKEYLIDLVGGPWENPEDIDFDSLPDQFVLKCTHDSGSVFICKDKKDFDIAEVKKEISKALKFNMYWYGREWPYKNVKPRIIAEKYMVDESGDELKDYKLYCFNGHVEMIQVIWGRNSKPKQNMYSTQWELISLNRKKFASDPNADIKKPVKLEEMITLAKKLSKDIPFLRTDFYSINDKIYFGELTFFPASGFVPFEPEFWDKKLGDMINLPDKE